jgi:hypothetical protein
MKYWKGANFSRGIWLLFSCILQLQICIDTYFKELKVTHIIKKSNRNEDSNHIQKFRSSFALL